jgi:ubiquinone/menaquinone biosynthesis C-methylase UbiE
MATLSDHEQYVTAAGRFGFTGLYDASIAMTMREGRWRPVLRDRLLATVPAGGRVLDVGAGTGTLAIALAAARPDVEVLGIDGDPETLALARAKPGAGAVRFEQGLAGRLELPDASVDAAVMSLALHHLAPDAKRRALADIARVLRSGGQLHIADWGRPATPLLRAGFFALQVIDGFEGTRDHAAGQVPQLLREAGFEDVRRYQRLRIVWGTFELLMATAP